MRNPVGDMKFETLEFPLEDRKYGKRAGDNKFRMAKCPFCGSVGHARNLPDGIKMTFTFTDLLSAREYEISGLCQTCQNDTFEEK